MFQGVFINRSCGKISQLLKSCSDTALEHCYSYIDIFVDTPVNIATARRALIGRIGRELMQLKFLTNNKKRFMLCLAFPDASCEYETQNKADIDNQRKSQNIWMIRVNLYRP